MFDEKKIKAGQKWLALNGDKFHKQCKICYVGSDATRIKIISLLDKYPKLCVSDIAKMMDYTISAVSHQLSLMERYELVKKAKKGKMAYYSLGKNKACFLYQNKKRK